MTTREVFFFFFKNMNENFSAGSELVQKPLTWSHSKGNKVQRKKTDNLFIFLPDILNRGDRDTHYCSLKFLTSCALRTTGKHAYQQQL